MTNISRINPRNIMLAIPCHDGKVMSELAGAMVNNANKFGAVTMPTECSHPSLVRNIIADTFLRSSFEWLIHWDSDIYPRNEDVDLLLQPTDPDGRYTTPDVDIGDAGPYTTQSDDSERSPTPTRIDTLTDSGTRTMADVLVCAEYSFKNEEMAPVRFGGGFVRVHRSVFRTLQEMKHPDDGRREVDARLLNELKRHARAFDALAPEGTMEQIPSSLLRSLFESETSKAGTPRLWQTVHKGRMFHDFYPSGPIINQFVPTAQWMGEDHGFFTLAMLAGIVARVETRTRLVHIGRKAYPYTGPDMNAGAQ